MVTPCNPLRLVSGRIAGRGPRSSPLGASENRVYVAYAHGSERAVDDGQWEFSTS